MTVITLAEAREQLPELLRRVAAGEQFVIADGDAWLATLGAPPPAPPTAEEEAERQTRLRALMREMVYRQIEAGHPPPPDSKIWELLPEEARR